MNPVEFHADILIAGVHKDVSIKINDADPDIGQGVEIVHQGLNFIAVHHIGEVQGPDIAFRIEKDVQFPPHPAFALAQGFLGLLDLRDVGMGTEHGQGLARIVTGHDTPLVENPDPSAVLVFHAELACVVGCNAGNAIRQTQAALFEVFRVDQTFPGRVVVGGQFLDGVSEHGCPLLVEAGFVGPDVPFPGPHTRAFDD